MCPGTEADIAGFLAGLREGDDEHTPLAASSAGRAVVAVRGLHAFAAAQGLTGADPARQVRPPAPPRRLPKAITVDEVERPAGRGRGRRCGHLAAGPARGPGPARVPVRHRRAHLGGRRPRHRRARHWRGEARWLRLSGKGGKQRIVPVGSYASQARAGLPRPGPARPWPRPPPGQRRALRPAASAAGPAVFLNARGGLGLTRQGAWLVLHAAAGRAGLASLSPHTLRHSYATHLLDGGADIRVVQELLGHASVTTTQVYTLVTVDRLREVPTPPRTPARSADRGVRPMRSAARRTAWTRSSLPISGRYRRYPVSRLAAPW